MKHSFADQVVWITGASAGIGRELARAFAAQGASVAVSARRKDRLDELVAEITGQGGRALAVVCDVTDEGSVRDAVAQIVDRLYRIDVAIANAGFSVAGRIESLSADDWRRQFDTNVVGTAMTARFALPELRKTRGRLALVGSVAGMICAPGTGAYHASKHAVRAMGQTLAMETHGTGVTVTTIHPGFVESEIAQVDNKGSFNPTRRDPRPARLMWTTDRAAVVMVDAIRRRDREYTFTAHGKVVGFLGRHAPGLVHAVITRAGIKYDRHEKAGG